MSPTCILNGASIHVETARALIASISGEFDLLRQVMKSHTPLGSQRT